MRPFLDAGVIGGEVTRVKEKGRIGPYPVLGDRFAAIFRVFARSLYLVPHGGLG
jgi:hypothetical protein